MAALHRWLTKPAVGQERIALGITDSHRIKLTGAVLGSQTFLEIERPAAETDAPEVGRAKREG